MDTTSATLEQLIDRDGILAVVTALSVICHNTADHLRSNWGPNATMASDWSKVGTALGKRPYAAATVIAEAYGQQVMP